MTRNVPTSGVDRLKAAGLAVSQWQSDDAIPRDELLTQVKGKDALFCLLTEKVDAELLDAAGELGLGYSAHCLFRRSSQLHSLHNTVHFCQTISIPYSTQKM